LQLISSKGFACWSRVFTSSCTEGQYRIFPVKFQLPCSNALLINEMNHVTIIGAGPAGLATAALLQKTGVDVLILEQANRIGERWLGGRFGPWGRPRQRRNCALL